MGGRHSVQWRALLRRRLATVRRRMAVTFPAVLIVFVASATSGMQSLASSASPGDAIASVSADGRSSAIPADDAPDLTTELAAEALAEAGAPRSGAGAIGSASHARSIGINAIVLRAHQQAAATLSRTTAGCQLAWPLLAAIGEVESHNARSRNVSANGDISPAILGPVLNGGRFAAISDSDEGRWDGDTRWDRAVGPMQFIPGTWARHGKDGNTDGTANPNNAFDASLSAGGYLCFGGRDLATASDLSAAIFSYNHSWTYVRTVLSWMTAFATGAARPVGSAPAPGTEEAVPAPTTQPAATPSPQPAPTPPATEPPTPSPSASASPSATPAPSPSPSASASPSATPAPSPSCSPSPTTSPSPSVSASPSGSSSPRPSRGGSASPSPSPSPSGSPSPSPSPSPSGSPSPSPSPSPPCGP